MAKIKGLGGPIPAVVADAMIKQVKDTADELHRSQHQ